MLLVYFSIAKNKFLCLPDITVVLCVFCYFGEKCRLQREQQRFQSQLRELCQLFKFFESQFTHLQNGTKTPSCGYRKLKWGNICGNVQHSKYSNSQSVHCPIFPFGFYNFILEWHKQISREPSTPPQIKDCCRSHTIHVFPALRIHVQFILFL